MNHNKILNEVSRFSVQAITEDLSRLMFSAMCYKKNWIDVQSYVLPKIADRWNCAIYDNNISVTDKAANELLLATILHKFGIQDATLTENAIVALDVLDSAVATSDRFHKHIQEAKDFISTIPIPLVRKPSIPKPITFYRAKDVISIQLGNNYYAAYVHYITGVNECPIIELYDIKLSHKPSIEDLVGVKAFGSKYNDGSKRTSRFGIYGLKYLPDPANQVHLIKACVDEIPDTSSLEESIGIYTVYDLFELQSVLKNI